MTTEEAFIKAASDRFEQHKMAGFGQLFQNMGGLKGLWNARNLAGGTGGGLSSMGQHVANAWSTLSPEAKKRIYGAGAGLVGGGLAGYLGSEDGDHGAATALGALGGMGLGHSYQRVMPHLRTMWGPSGSP